jgi:hypothetical protein
VLHHPSPDDAEHLRSLARRAATLLRERHGVVVHVGIGESGSGVAALAASCTDAKDAVRLAGDSTGVEIREISHLRVRRLLDSASTVARTRFTRWQLDRLSRENDFPVLRQTDCGLARMWLQPRDDDSASGHPPQHGHLPAGQDIPVDRTRRPGARGGNRAICGVPRQRLPFAGMSRAGIGDPGHSLKEFALFRGVHVVGCCQPPINYCHRN